MLFLFFTMFNHHNRLNTGSVFLSSETYMVGLGRLELPTLRLSGVRSNQLSYKPLMKKNFQAFAQMVLLLSTA
jgi:hypothetical protein